MFKNDPAGLEVLSALCCGRAERKTYLRERFKHLTPRGSLDKLEQLQKSNKKHQALLAGCSHYLKYRKRFKRRFCWCLWCRSSHLYPKLLFIHTGARPLLIHPSLFVFFFPRTVKPSACTSFTQLTSERTKFARVAFMKPELLKGHSTDFSPRD